MIAVNKVKLKPVDRLFLKQKLDKAPCRHLKKLNEIEAPDYENDEMYSVTCCSQCGKEMSITDIRKREKALQNFNKEYFKI